MAEEWVTVQPFLCLILLSFFISVQDDKTARLRKQPSVLSYRFNKPIFAFNLK